MKCNSCYGAQADLFVYGIPQVSANQISSSIILLLNDGDPSKLECIKLQDLHPASWYLVAWYPIYRIPEGCFRASFLTYHSLGHLHLRCTNLCSVAENAFCVVSPSLGMQRYNAQEDSAKTGKVTSAGMFFLCFPVYRLDQTNSVEINEAWKVKPNVDRTLLPKGKAQAKFEAVTLPDAVDMEVEQSMNFFSDDAVRFQRMRLDDLDEYFININLGDNDQSQPRHQADAANITLFDDFGSCLAETELYNRFERFDVGGDEEEEIQMNFTPQEQPKLVPSPALQVAQHQQPPSSRVSSPPTTHHEPPTKHEPMVEEQEKQQPEDQTNAAQEADGAEPKQRQRNLRRSARRNLTRVIMDDEQIMIPGNTYQLWLQDASSIVSKRGRKTKPRHPISTTKISILMELPPLALMTGLDNFPSQLHYPAPLLELWRKCVDTTAAHSSTSEGTSPEAPQNPPSHSPPEALSHRNHTNPEFSPGDFQIGDGSQPDASPIEKLVLAEPVNMEFHSIFSDADMASSDHFNTPRSPAGQSSGSIRSSGSGHTFLPFVQEMLPNSTRYKKRQHSSARSDLGNLDPVEEEVPMVQDVRDSKMRRLSENRPPQDSDLLEETGPTQTPHQVITEPTIDKITQSIRSHLKSHFDTPGNPQTESIDQLASGMNRKKAAALFYQTCVLATLDFVKVHQAEAYGDIMISRGPKM